MEMARTSFPMRDYSRRGHPLASIVVQRIRQYPVDFGRISTFVQTVELPAIEEAAKLFVERLNYSGIAEIELKRDRPDGAYKLLDFNPRFWWHSLCRSSGNQFPYLLWRWIFNEPVERCRARTNVKWVHLTYDLPALAAEIRQGACHYQVILALSSRLQHLRFLPKMTPLPAICEILLML